MKITESVDVLVIGSGMGGATFAAGLAPTGTRILVLERGERLRDFESARDARAIFQRGALGLDSTEPVHSTPYPFGPVPDEPAIAAVRQRLKKIGLNPFSLPLGI